MVSIGAVHPVPIGPYWLLILHSYYNPLDPVYPITIRNPQPVVELGHYCYSMEVSVPEVKSINWIHALDHGPWYG